MTDDEERHSPHWRRWGLYGCRIGVLDMYTSYGSLIPRVVDWDSTPLLGPNRSTRVTWVLSETFTFRPSVLPVSSHCWPFTMYRRKLLPSSSVPCVHRRSSTFSSPLPKRGPRRSSSCRGDSGAKFWYPGWNLKTGGLKILLFEDNVAVIKQHCRWSLII